ncbi:diguanylate cyclase/phosphodiesterase (GGDEF & EAL domains) with PAS/PAC sensor(s) [Chitinispirillum alkaliphilum]|nr:diguanylate cyclase/phosphodiesterase (GGDEF & EAL domains) with PAS/PAC sensor(s) [Chitinispirillum alkaliphilum]
MDKICNKLHNSVCSEPSSGKKLNETIATAFFENASEGIVITDSETIVTSVNPSFTNITGYHSSEVLGKKISLLKSDRHDEQFYKLLWTSLKREGKWQGEIWNRRKNGEIYPGWLIIVAIANENNGSIHYIGIFTDITKYINKNIQIRNHAYYDSLTGLPNRMLLQDRLSFMVNHARRNNQIMALLLMDLNRFKFINDTLGYQTGDIILQTISERLKDCLRDVDAVFRLGDDEFAIILEEIARQQDAAKVAKKILAACSMPFQLPDHELFVTTSIGISIFPNDGDNSENLLKNGEAAMERAKQIGMNNYQHYMPNMNAKAFEQLTLEHNLRKALKKDEFTVYYQPQIDILNGGISGLEALIRWKHPELGMISPAQFIPIAEETGLILPIGEWVLRTACYQIKRLQQQFKRDFIISVNLSARQFQQQDLISVVNSALDNAHLDPQSLELEITESLGMQNPEITIKTLDELKSMGVKIAIDDFGTGYSSLSYLKKFPIDTLKIDRSFVKDIPGDPNDSAIVDAVIALAHIMNLDVVAEGVEDEEQLFYLQNHYCEKVQGYYFSPPVDSNKLAELVQRSLTDAKFLCHKRIKTP